MALKATNPLISDAYARIKGTAFQLKNYTDARSALFASGATEQEILAAVDNLTSMKNSIVGSSAVPGLSEYAIIQENDPVYDIIVEYNTMIAALDAVLAYITTNIPAPRTFDTLQLAPLKTLLDDLSLTIE